MSITPNKKNIDPIDLLTDRADRQLSFLNQIYIPIGSAIMGFLTVTIMRWSFRKPIFSGIQTHVFASVLGVGIGTFFNEKRNERIATRDAILKHYIELHPDDFPPVVRVKYGDLLERWTPIR